MKARTIGGVIWLVLIIGAFLTGLFGYLNVIFWFIGIYEIFKMYKNKPTNFAFLYAFVYTLGIASLIYLYNYSEAILLLVIISVMLCDSFAYLTGKSFGKHHFSKISPNKTLEGLAGGIIITLVIDIILVNFVPYFNDAVFMNVWQFVIILLFVLIAGIYGDLFESKLKRLTEVKDSGNIIYGHGGICDRIDSWVLAAIPIVVTFILLGA